MTKRLTLDQWREKAIANSRATKEGRHICHFCREEFADGWMAEQHICKADEENLCAEFQAYLTAQGLPQMSADELLHEDLTTEQRRYISDFYDRWEAMLARQGE